MNPADGKLLRGCIVGLRAKGKAKRDATGFVLGPELHTIAPYKPDTPETLRREDMLDEARDVMAELGERD